MLWNHGCTQINMDEEREEMLRKAAIVLKDLGLSVVIPGSHCLEILDFSSSVFICVHPWFQRVSSCA
jgi:hypothetical protein